MLASEEIDISEIVPIPLREDRIFLGKSVITSSSTYIEDIARAEGTLVLGSKGHGKSSAIGKIIAYEDASRKIPTIIFDPAHHNGVIDSFLDRVVKSTLYRLDRTDEPFEVPEIVDRLRYVDMSCSDGYVTPFPLFYHYSNAETLASISSRFLDVIRLLDPHLDDAPVNGTNGIKPVLIALGAVLYPLGFQVTEAEDILSNHTQWKERLAKLANDTKNNRQVGFVIFLRASSFPE